MATACTGARLTRSVLDSRGMEQWRVFSKAIQPDLLLDLTVMTVLSISETSGHNSDIRDGITRLRGTRYSKLAHWCLLQVSTWVYLRSVLVCDSRNLGLSLNDLEAQRPFQHDKPKEKKLTSKSAAKAVQLAV